MIFKEVHLPNGKIKFLMGNNPRFLKEVTEETYLKLIEDDSINIPNINLNSQNNNQDNNEYNDKLTLIQYLKEIDPKESVEIVDSLMQENFLRGTIYAYEEMGMVAHKLAARVENYLDDQMYEEENY